MTRALGALRAFRSVKLSLGMGLLLALVLIGALHQQIVDAIGHGGDPLGIGFDLRYLKPSRAHLLGTDQVGRDELALVVTGLWTSLQIGAVAGVLSTLIGITVAFFAAYRGGWLDSALATTTDMFLVIPTLPLLIAFASFAKDVNLVEIGVILAVFSWAGAARAIRSHVLSLRSRAYVDLARVTKLSDVEIIFEELIPNMLPYIALGLALAAINSIFALVGLEVIGFGPSSVIDLGLLVYTAIRNGVLSLGVWPMFIAPILVIALLFFALNLINIGLEEVFNPRLRKVAGG
jgi:peptide/nickel transport system permease protein